MDVVRVIVTSRLTKYQWLEQKVQHFNIQIQFYYNEENVMMAKVPIWMMMAQLVLTTSLLTSWQHISWSCSLGGCSGLCPQFLCPHSGSQHYQILPGIPGRFPTRHFPTRHFPTRHFHTRHFPNRHFPTRHFPTSDISLLKTFPYGHKYGLHGCHFQNKQKCRSTVKTFLKICKW